MKQKQVQFRWTPHQDPYEKFRANFSVSYMSNAKWRKVLTAIALSGITVERAEWKFIDSDHIYNWSAPRLSDILPRRLADGRFQPVEYKWIEWIKFPCTYKPYDYEKPSVGYYRSQDLENLQEVIKSCGEFYIELENESLTLFGYGK